jgi:glycosyltransferase involved in cell wall biosynthesis
VKLSVIIPAYNEEDVIAKTVRELSEYLSAEFPGFEIVIVSDGSRDKTLETAQKLESRSIRAFEYHPNRGKGHALKYGFGKTSGDLIVFYDAGLDFVPAQVGDFINLLQKSGVDVVIGSKRHPESKVNYPLKRRLISFGGQVLVRVLFRLNITDTQVGLKVFRREVLEEVLPRVLVRRFAFDIELLALTKHYGFRIKEAPVDLNLTFPTAGTLSSVVKTLVDTLAIFYRLKILNFYDRPAKERQRALKDYRPTVFDRFFGSRPLRFLEGLLSRK